MKRPVEAIKRHHAKILERIRAIPGIVAHLPQQDAPARRAALREVVTFLEGELLPHAQGEEAHLYPAVDPLWKQYRPATTGMSLEHRRIEEIIAAFRRQADELSTEAGAPTDRLLETAHHLDAILALHLEKEETVLLPLADEHLTEAELEKLVHRMHEAHAA